MYGIFELDWQEVFTNIKLNVSGNKVNGNTNYTFSLIFDNSLDIAALDGRLNKIFHSANYSFKESNKYGIEAKLGPDKDYGSLYESGLKITIDVSEGQKSPQNALKNVANFVTHEIGGALHGFVQSDVISDIKKSLELNEFNDHWKIPKFQKYQIKNINLLSNRKITINVNDQQFTINEMGPVLGNRSRFVETYLDIQKRILYDQHKILNSPISQEVELHFIRAQYHAHHDNFEFAEEDFSRAILINYFLIENTSGPLADFHKNQKLHLEVNRLKARVHACREIGDYGQANALAKLTYMRLSQYIDDHFKPDSFSVYRLGINIIESDLDDKSITFDLDDNAIEVLVKNQNEGNKIMNYMMQKKKIKQMIGEVVFNEDMELISIAPELFESSPYISLDEQKWILEQTIDNVGYIPYKPDNFLVQMHTEYYQFLRNRLTDVDEQIMQRNERNILGY